MRLASPLMVAVAIVSALLATSPAQAQPRARAGGVGLLGVEALQRQARNLDWDEATRKKIDGVVDEARPEIARLEQELREAHQALRALLEREAPVEGDVMKQADEIGRIEVQLEKRWLAVLLAARGVLSPEQLAELSGVRASRRQTIEQACAGEAERLCPDLPAGPQRRQCLRSKQSQVSKTCREALAARDQGPPRAQ